MIQIGTKIWITDDLNESELGKVNTNDSKVYYQGELVGGVNYLEIKYDSNEGMGRKICSIYLLESANQKVTNEFAKEMAQHGFNVETIHTFGDFRHIEYYILDGKFVQEVKIPGFDEKNLLEFKNQTQAR